MRGINHLFLRFIYLLIAWVVAFRPLLSSKGITDVNHAAFYATLFLFFIPLIVDYWGIMTSTKVGTFLRTAGMYTTIFAIVAVVIGSFSEGSLNIEKATLFTFPIKVYWYVLGFWIFLSMVDWIAYTFHPGEVAFQNKITEVMRKKKIKFNKDITVKARIPYYSKTKGGEL